MLFCKALFLFVQITVCFKMKHPLVFLYKSISFQGFLLTIIIIFYVFKCSPSFRCLSSLQKLHFPLFKWVSCITSDVTPPMIFSCSSLDTEGYASMLCEIVQININLYNSYTYSIIQISTLNSMIHSFSDSYNFTSFLHSLSVSRATGKERVMEFSWTSEYSTEYSK
jgi:energy-coupling factor transporter transmembrane protein EcfT